jgi:negative regulator of flagellin synthesis FlgM
MIDPVSPGRIGPVTSRSVGAAAVPVASATNRSAAVPATANSLSALPRTIAAEGAPIDIDRISALKNALASDSYAIDAARIAAAMLADEGLSGGEG